jgi:hypothetical protein
MQEMAFLIIFDVGKDGIYFTRKCMELIYIMISPLNICLEQHDRLDLLKTIEEDQVLYQSKQTGKWSLSL